MYNGIPHLLAPVVTDPKKAANTLNWAVGEMTRRYGLFAEVSVRDFRGYNEELARNREQPLPLVLIVIDELADLMQVASKEVEESIARLTAMARAAGIHLLIATQRPSVDVITGVIKANIPSRIAFAVSSQVDSRTILDMSGAENLLGKGDMLYYPQSAAKPQRGQGAFVSDGEVESVIEYLKSQNMGTYDPEEVEAIISASLSHAGSSGDGSKDEDELLPQAVEIVLMAGCASVSILQRRMNIGYPRAARLIDHMQDKGYVGPFEGSKPRKLLISQSQWLEIQAKGG
jgi:DNA segregation ATPase FtsK/SpoIIIE-like protein